MGAGLDFLPGEFDGSDPGEPRGSGRGDRDRLGSFIEGSATAPESIASQAQPRRRRRSASSNTPATKPAPGDATQWQPWGLVGSGTFTSKLTSTE